MNYLVADGFCSLYPKQTFSGVGLLAPISLSAISLPDYPIASVLRKYQARGYRFVTNRESVIEILVDNDVPPVTYDPEFRIDRSASRSSVPRGTEDGRCLTVSFGTRHVPYRTGATLHDDEWRVGWCLGGVWDTDTDVWSSKVFTFNPVTGRQVSLTPYLAQIEEGNDYVDEVD